MCDSYLLWYFVCVCVYSSGNRCIVFSCELVLEYDGCENGFGCWHFIVNLDVRCLCMCVITFMVFLKVGNGGQ